MCHQGQCVSPRKVSGEHDKRKRNAKWKTLSAVSRDCDQKRGAGVGSRRHGAGRGWGRRISQRQERPTQAPRAASPAHASWQSRPCPGPGPGCSPPPASAPRGCHGNLRSRSEATHAPQAKPRFPGLETWKQALPPRLRWRTRPTFPNASGLFSRKQVTPRTVSP